MSWKDHYHFSYKEKVGIIILIILIVLTRVLFWLVPQLFPIKNISTDIEQQEFAKQISEFKANLKEIEENRKKSWKKYPTHYSKEKPTYTLFQFDPNTADQETLQQLGIKPNIAKNIIKYRSKGGKFNKATDFAKIYGITPTQYQQLEPYIDIKQQTTTTQSETPPILIPTLHTATKTIQADTLPYIVELNTADTASLIAIKGIGKYTANQIIHYRKQLGGFYRIEQLTEVKGIRAKNFDKIKPHLTIETNNIKKINVNKASIEQLKRHPYIQRFTKAKAIYDYRRKKIKLNSIEQLYVLDEFSKEEINRLKPYLNFE